VIRGSLRFALTAAALLVAGCGTDQLPVDDEGLTRVGEVRLEVPDGWQAADEEEPPGVLDSQRWRPEGAELTGLQLVVACDGDLDDLVTGIVRSGRGGLRVTDAAETAALDVPGLDATRGLVLDLEGTLAGVEAGELRTAGLYGQSGGALLLLELAQRVDDFDPDLAEEIFTSVRVDGEELQARCEETS
jgi:hypothetical protein